MSDIILIGGPPGAGKTTLAAALAAHLERKTITMDDLVVAARSVADAATHPALFPAKGQTHFDYFTDSSPEKLIADARALAEAAWPIAERTIRFHRASKKPLVMDYWLFEPAVIAGLDPAAAALWLHIDPAALERRERTTNFTDGSTDPEAMHRNFMARNLWRNDYLATRADEFGQPVLRLTGEELPDDVLSAALRVLE